MKVPGNAGGKTFKCVKCGNHIIVGADAVVSAEAPPTDTGTKVPPALEPIGQILVDAGCITQLQLDEALAEQRREGGKTFEILIRLGYLDKARLHEVLSKQPGIATIDLSRVSIDRELSKLVTKELALQHLVLPIDKLGRLLTVAMACPLDVATIAALEKDTGLKVKAMLCRYDDIHAAVQKQYPEDGGEGAMHTFQLPAGYDAAPKSDVAEKLNRLEDLHYRAETLTRLDEALRAPGNGLGALVEILIEDPALVAALLRTANSAVYGMPGQVDGIALALALLGRDGLAALVARCRKLNIAPQANLATLAEGAARTARHAAILARATGRVGRELAFTAGALHGVGAHALEAASAQRYGKINTGAALQALAAEEKQAFGLGHDEAAQVLLKRWRLPESLQLGVGRYLAPEGAGQHAALASLVRAASAPDLAQAAEAAGAKPDALNRAVREEEALRASQKATAF